MSKFDIGMATTTRYQMQCRQSCSWHLLICFEQRQIFQVFWLVYFPWVEVICFLLVEKPVCTTNLEKKLGINLYQKNNCLQLFCLQFFFSSAVWPSLSLLPFYFIFIYVPLSFTLLFSLLFCLLLALVAQVVLDVIFPSGTVCQIFLRGM